MTITALVTRSLGIGANRALFRSINGVFLLDLFTFALIAGSLLRVVLTASYFPARRATPGGPMVALRAE